MFKLTESDKEIKSVRAFCAKGFFGAKINTALAAYGTDDRFVRTWYEEADKKIISVMQLTEGAATVKCTDQTDFDSLAALLLFAGAKTVTGSRDAVEKLPFGTSQKGFLMHAHSVPDVQTDAERIDSESLRCLYDILFADEEIQNPRRHYAVWLTDMSHRVRHGLCECFAVYENEVAVSCASVLYSNAQYGCIGAVATMQASRHKGYGKDCTLTAAQSILNNGITPCLACADSGIHKWYETMGFTVYGEWAEALI